MMNCNSLISRAVSLLAVLSLAVFGLAACPKPADNAPAPATGATAPEQAAAPESQAEPGPQPGTAVPAGGEAAATGGPVAPQPDQGSDDPVERPKPRTKRPGDTVTALLEFVKAEYNDTPEANLSHLEFEFTADLGRMDTRHIGLTKSEIMDAASAELDMGLCLVEVIPVVNPPYQTGRTSKGGSRFRIDGSYRINVYTVAGELMGVFALNAEGIFLSAPPEEWPEGFGLRALHKADNYGPVPYTIYRIKGEGGHAEYIVTLEFNRGTFDSQTVHDPSFNDFEYQFPNGQLELYTPDLTALKSPKSKRR